METLNMPFDHYIIIITNFKMKFICIKIHAMLQKEDYITGYPSIKVNVNKASKIYSRCILSCEFTSASTGA